MKKNRFHKRKLTKDNQWQVCLWLAEVRTYAEIQKLLQEEGVSVSRSYLWQFGRCKKWNPIIIKLKSKFLADLTAIPIANKATRLRYLQNLYRECMTEGIIGYSKKGDPIYGLRIKESEKAIELARKELEGDSKLIDIGSNGKQPDIHITVNVKADGKDKAGPEFDIRLDHQAERSVALPS